MSLESKERFWLLEPVARAIQYLAEETYLASTLHKSLVVLEGNETILRLAREPLANAGYHAAVRGIDELLKEAPSLSGSAAKVRADDFAVLNSHTLIAVWGAVEVAIEDTVTMVLVNDSTALSAVSAAGIKTTAFEPPPLSEESARRLAGRMERQLRKDLRVGEFYIKVLGLFGIDVSCSRHVLSKLQEANSVRNCLLHRGGVIDDRAAKICAALRPLLGKQIVVSRGSYLNYYDAMSEFLQAMSKGVIAGIKQGARLETNT